MVDAKDIGLLLKNLNLDEKESLIYKALLYEDSLTVLDLSRKVSLPRSTVYRICTILVGRNFLKWVIEHQGKKVRAILPHGLISIVEQKESEIQKAKDAIERLTALERIIPKKIAPTEVRYYYGLDGMKQLVWNTLDAKKETFGYSMWGRTKIIGLKFERKYTAERLRRAILDKVIINQKGLELLTKEMSVKDVGVGQKIRVIGDKGFEIIGDIYIYNDIYAVNIWSKNEIIGVEIENPDIVKVQKSIFMKLWKEAEPLEKFLTI